MGSQAHPLNLVLSWGCWPRCHTLLHTASSAERPRFSWPQILSKRTSPSAPGLTKPLLASHHSCSLAKAGHMAKVRADVEEVYLRTWIPRGTIRGGCDSNRPLTDHWRNKRARIPLGAFPALVSGFLSFLGLVMLEMKFSKMSLGLGGV